MNNRGSVVIYGLMLGMLIIILALALAPAVQDFTTEAMNQTVGDKAGLDCSNESISNFDKGACISVDLTLFYFIGSLIFIGGLILTSRIIFS